MAGVLWGMTLGLACLVALMALAMVVFQMLHARFQKESLKRDERIGHDILAVLDGESTWAAAVERWTQAGDTGTARRVALRLAGTVKGSWLGGLQDGYRSMGGIEADLQSLVAGSLALRLRALDHLDVMADGRDIPALEDALRDRVSLVRARAAKLLLQLHAPVEFTVASMLAQGRWRTGSEWLGQALAAYGGAGTEGALLEILRDGSLEVRVQERLLEVLVERRAPAVRRLVLSWCGDPLAERRAVAVRCLGRFEHPDDIEWVEGCLRDPDARVRLAALETMDHHGVPIDTGQFDQLLLDQDAQVRGYVAGLWVRRPVAGGHP